MGAGPPEPAARTGGRQPDQRRDQRRDRRRVRMVPGGPVLVEGPVEVILEDGRTVVSDRFLVALCACRRSRTYPFCDTSHRRRARAPSPDGDGGRAAEADGR